MIHYSLTKTHESLIHNEWVLTERLDGQDVDDHNRWHEQSLTTEEAHEWADKILIEQGRPEVDWNREDTPFGERWTATVEDETP